MSMNTYPVDLTAFYFDDIACAYMVKGILSEQLASGVLSLRNLEPEERIPVKLSNEIFRKFIEDEAKRKSLPSSFFQAETLDCIAGQSDVSCLCYISNFDGDVKTNTDICNAGGISDSFSEAFIVYLPLDKASSLLHAAYGSVEEVVEELKEKIGSYFPADFDFASRICDIDGASLLY